MEVILELVFLILELLGSLLFETLLPRLPNRHGGYGCVVVMAALALLIGSIMAYIAIAANLWRPAATQIQ